MNPAARHALWRRARRVLPSALIWTTVGLCAWWVWPTRFGGDTTTLVVEGHSMEPTYHNGDLIVAHADDHYRPGEIVVFKIQPPGDHAHEALIVHRLIAIDPDGHITTQGDNRSVADGFGLTTANIVGRARLRIPSGGTFLRVMSRWWMLAVVSGLIVTMTLWPSPPGVAGSPDELEERDAAPATA
ncbi:MAG: signal peptidase I [Ilumatobacteraceae bacterium]